MTFLSVQIILYNIKSNSFTIISCNSYHLDIMRLINIFGMKTIGMHTEFKSRGIISGRSVCMNCNAMYLIDVVIYNVYRQRNDEISLYGNNLSPLRKHG